MYRPGSSLTKAKMNKGGGNATGLNINMKKKEKVPQLEDYLKERDWVGAIVHLEYYTNFQDKDTKNKLWLAYAYFHSGEY